MPKTLAYVCDLARDSQGDKFVAVSVLEQESSEVILRSLVAYLLKGKVDTGIQNGACNRNQDTQFLLRHPDTESFRDGCDQTNHLGRLPFEEPAIYEYARCPG